MFQTASLYSIEVDYYHYGTCEIEGGSYFCGDHSCNTFKHVGTDLKAGAVLSEHNVYRSATNLHYDNYVHGSGNVLGTRDQHGFVANNPPTVDGTHVQAMASGPGLMAGDALLDQSRTADARATRPHGYPLRGDAQTPVYHMHDGKRLPSSVVKSIDAGTSVIGTDGSTVRQDGQRTLTLGECKRICDADDTCKGFQENRWQYLGVTIKCRTLHMSGWLTEYPAIVSGLETSNNYDFFVKEANAKPKTWLNAPMTNAFRPTTGGSSGRRLDGVY